MIGKNLALASALALTIALPAHAQWWKSVFTQQADINNPQYGYNGQPQYGYNQQQYGGNNFSQVSDNMKNIERTSDKLAQSLQMRMGMPGAQNVAPLLVALNALKDTARQARRSADSNNASDLSMKLSQLQVVAGNALTVSRGMDGYTVAQLQMLQSSIQQSIMLANAVPINPNPYNPNPYNPNPYNPNPYYPNGGGFYSGALAASGNGRGQFSLMGQVLMGIKQATINSGMGGRAVTLTVSGGGAAVNLTGIITNQTPNSATMSVNGSDKGAATGVVNAMIGGDGSLSSVNGNGTMNGQPFAISFRGN